MGSSDAVNDIAPIKKIVYLLKCDTVYGHYEKAVDGHSENLIISGVLSS